ncbi:hypothetical protein [Nocardioides sp. TF02-7]|uniref:hypothetical protein n=1 Tax=Nocardioides sp. TF02-7 TaxID=2917724 RepID=UPI001F06F9C6|nr:hypothetical protein [Nocardioides sp. TF02-7]UMG92025.1 hypothetical protein MF408_18880 [Nocardioides sp. TF02-7]
MSDRAAGPVLVATDAWFLRHGLTYFVPEQRAAVRAALRVRRTLVPAVLVVVVALSVAVALVSVSGDLGAGPAVLVTIAVLALVTYGVTALRAGHILGWGLSRTFGSLRRLLPMVMRALPLLLLFVTFLFINAEVWQMAAAVSVGALWLTALLFAATALTFLVIRLPEEVDKVDDDVDDAFLLRACRDTPLEEACVDLVADPDADPASYATIVGYERWNLVLSLLVVQLVQVVLIAAGVFAFFLVFGSLVMTDSVQLAWTGSESLRSAEWLPTVSVELLRVSFFLASFSLLYLTVSTVTDDAYREQFFGGLLRELERAVGMRAVYLALRARERPGAP